MRCRCNGINLGRDESALQLAREQQIRKFALSVGRPRLVLHPAHQVIEVHHPGLVQVGRDRHDSCPRCLFDEWKQQSGECEVAEVVRAELRFEAVCGHLSLGHTHNAGVVHQDVEILVALDED